MGTGNIMLKNYHRLTPEHRDELMKNPLYSKLIAEFRDGWFKLLHDLGNDIKDLCDLTGEIYPTVLQTKEKFGTLRFYYRDNSENEIVKKCIRALVTRAENQSDGICEICGGYGELVCNGGRWETVCDEHKEEGSLTVEEWQQWRIEKEKERQK